MTGVRGPTPPASPGRPHLSRSRSRGTTGRRPRAGRGADGGALADVVRAWAPTRALVPVVAVLGEGERLVRSRATRARTWRSRRSPAPTARGRCRRSRPRRRSRRGTRARPVPVEAARAAQAAVAEGCDVSCSTSRGRSPGSCRGPRSGPWPRAATGCRRRTTPRCWPRWRPPAATARTAVTRTATPG